MYHYDVLTMRILDWIIIRRFLDENHWNRLMTRHAKLRSLSFRRIRPEMIKIKHLVRNSIAFQTAKRSTLRYKQNDLTFFQKVEKVLREEEIKVQRT
jgi:hypothetical protein